MKALNYFKREKEAVKAWLDVPLSEGVAVKVPLPEGEAVTL